jgi:hypothetical protein
MTTAAEVAEHNAKVLRNVDRLRLVTEYAESIGCTYEQASTMAKAYSERFVYDGATLSFNGKPVTAARDDVIAHFKEHKLNFLLPKAGDTEQPDVDPDLLASARAGNKTARAQIYKQTGDLAKTDALIAQKPAADKGDDDASKNPWRAKNFRSDKDAQARASGIIRRLGTATAANLARAAGVTLDGRPLRA